MKLKTLSKKITDNQTTKKKTLTKKPTKTNEGVKLLKSFMRSSGTEYKPESKFGENIKNLESHFSTSKDQDKLKRSLNYYTKKLNLPEDKTDKQKLSAIIKETRNKFRKENS